MSADVQKVIDGYVAAAAARDINAFMQLYDPAARIFDAWGVWEYTDLGAWRKGIEGWFGSHPGDRLQVTFEDVRISSSAELASVSAIVIYAVVPAGEVAKDFLQNRLTWVLKQSGGGFRILHEHTSFPVGFEGKLAMLRK